MRRRSCLSPKERLDEAAAFMSRVQPLGRTCVTFQRRQAPVAQLDRAPDYESGGQEFESLRARQHLADFCELLGSRKPSATVCRHSPRLFGTGASSPEARGYPSTETVFRSVQNLGRKRALGARAPHE